MQTFSPAEQFRFTDNVARCLLGKAPTLAALREAYGRQSAESWIEIQLQSISEFSGAREKLSIEQVEELAQAILSQFDALKVTEMMLFIARLKSGAFSKLFYGAVDAIAITDALQTFVKDIGQEKYELLREKEKAEKKERDRLHDIEVDAFRGKWQAIGISPLQYVRHKDICENAELSVEEKREALASRGETL